MTDPNKVLLAQGAIGADAEDFLRSELGRTLLGLARAEAVASLSKLRTVASWRRRKIAQLQSEVWRAESFEGWLRSLIVTGQQSLREYDRRTEVILEDHEDGSHDTQHPETHND